MPMYYTPRVLLRQVPNALLWEYFVEKRKQLRDVSWGRLRQTDVAEVRHD